MTQIAGTGALLAGSRLPEAVAAESGDLGAPPVQTVRVGFVGVGGRGSALMRQLLRSEGCRITAGCDLIAERVARMQQAVEEAGFPKPAAHHKGPTDCRNLCEREDVDLVMTATPWKLHAPVCVAALEAGQSAAEGEYEPIEWCFPEFEHPLWRDLAEKPKSSGHGGSDFLTCNRLIKALRTGTYPDIDVCDGAAWSCIVELSELSAGNRSRAMDFPDFTRGRWRARKPLPNTGA